MVLTWETRIVANETDNKWIGKRTIRPDGEDKVTGRANFGADFAQPHMLWGKILRSPHPHARIKSINLERAARAEGVRAVMCGDDLVHFPMDIPAPAGPQDLRYVSRNVMARDKALYAGHAVAALAATSASAADAALDLIDVEYEVLPWVIDVEEAMQSDAPLLHESMYTQGVDPQPSRPSNIASRSGLNLGDVDAGFAEADIVIERQFKTKPVHQGYIEPHACLVDASPSGQATIWSSSQGQFMVRNVTARMTGAKLSDIRAIPAEIGGGFGGKTIIYLEPLAYTLSRKAGAPVKMVMTREEVFRATGPTAGSSNTVKIGARRDGRITAAQATFRFQAGAFPSSPIRGASNCAFSAYAIDNVRVTGYDIVANRPKCNAYRAPGSPIAAFGVESVIDELAAELGIDPIEFRLMNAAREGTRAAYGPTFRRIGCEETLRAAQSHPHYSAQTQKGRLTGRGVACGGWMNAGGESSAQINVNEDRHRRHHDRPPGHRRLPRLDGEHRGGDSGHPLPQHQRPGRRHQHHRLQRQHRRQPRDLRGRRSGVAGRRKPWWSNCGNGSPCSGTSTWTLWTGKMAMRIPPAPTRASSNRSHWPIWHPRPRSPADQSRCRPR